MDFKTYLERSAKEVDIKLDQLLNEWLKEVARISPKLTPLAKAFIRACSGGKRIRGTLCKLGYELAMSSWLVQDQDSGVASAPQNDIVQIGAAYEIFHAAILAHDDIMDQSETRRGLPSLYKKVGVSEAITLGDLGFFLAMRIISNSFFAKIALDTAIGQLLDLKKGDPVATAKLKTARYTIAGPLQLGAILGGAKGKLVGDLGRFGENLGIAFQIKDDILDGESSGFNQAKKYVTKAQKLIPSLTKDPILSTLLNQMAEYLVERTK